MTTIRMWGWMQGAVALLVLLSLALMAAGPPAEEFHRRPSTYAPAGDLESQVQYFLDRVEDDLKDPSQYDESRMKRVVKDANTLAVLALVLGKHDESNQFKSSAPTLLERSLQLADSAPDHGAAKQAYERLLRIPGSPGSSTELAWRSVGNIADLMNQVPNLNTSLRGTVRSETRFKKNPEKAAGLAATLAAIAQVSMFDSTYCADIADQADWVELCGLMRDAAYEVNRAVHRGDQEAAIEGLKPLARTCDDCHDQFTD
jgi:hypothetical protein